MNRCETPKVLLVEDTKRIAIRVERRLREMGFDVVRAEDGKAGLAILLTDTGITHLRTDNQMPEMMGITLLERLCDEHADRLRQLTHVVFKSTDFDSDDKIGPEVRAVCKRIEALGVPIILTEGAMHETEIWQQLIHET